MKRKFLSIIIVASILFSACTSNVPKAENRIFTDSLGRQVTLPLEIKSIASTGAMSQMVLLPIASDLFCGLSSDWSQDAELYISQEVLSLPLYGQIYGSKGDVNLETVISLSPDVIVDIGENKDGIREDLDKLTKATGIPIVHIDSSLTGMADTYRMLGELLSREEAAKILADYCEELLFRTQDMMQSLGSENLKTVLYCLGDKGLNVLAQNSYHAELLDMLCNNAAVVENPISSGMGNEVDMEQLLIWDPEIIIFAESNVYESVKSDPLWKKLSAISSGNYYKVPQGPYNWMGMPPSINRYLGMLWLTNLLYPEYMKNSLYEETSHFYKLFYNCDLTEEMFNKLIE